MAGGQEASTEIIDKPTGAGESTSIWNAKAVKNRCKSV
jgi:hypothetical protein